MLATSRVSHRQEDRLHLAAAQTRVVHMSPQELAARVTSLPKGITMDYCVYYVNWIIAYLASNLELSAG